MNPSIPSSIDTMWEHHQERLKQAEQWRQAKRRDANHFSRVDRLRIRIGERLIALGQSLKAAVQPAPQFD